MKIPRHRNSTFLIILSLITFTALPRIILAADTPVTSKDGRLQIHLPPGYSQKPPAKPTIKIEAVNETENATILVLSEGQQKFASLAEYADCVRDQMTAHLKDAQTDAGEKLQAGGNPAIRYEITGISTAGYRMAFLVTVVQTETRFNQVVGSCSRGNFAKNKAEFAKVAEGLKELPGK